MHNPLRHYPQLRLVVPMAAGMLVGDRLSLAGWGEIHVWWAIGGSALVIALALALAAHRRDWLRTFYTALLLAFLCMGFLRITFAVQEVDYPFTDQTAIYQVLIRETPEPKAKSMLCRVTLQEEWPLPSPATDSLEATPTPTKPATFLLYLALDSASRSLTRGDLLLVQTRLRRPDHSGIPDAFDYGRYLLRHGVSGTAYAASGQWRRIGHDPHLSLRQRALDLRDRVSARYRALGFCGDALATLSALTLGDKDELSEEIIETYTATGARHVLALSGLHVGFVYIVLLWLLRPLWRRWDRLKPVALVVTAIALWAFALITGLSTSVVRAVVMCSLHILVTCVRTEPAKTMDTLLITALLMLLYQPFWLLDVGFQLSVAAVTSILVLQPRLYELLMSRQDYDPTSVRQTILRYLWGLITVSVAAQVGTAPLVMYYFSRLPVHFLLTNLWIIPMVTVTMYLAAAMLVLWPLPAVQGFVAHCLDQWIGWQNSGLRFIESIPYGSIDNVWLSVGEVIALYLFVLALVHLMDWPLRRRMWVAILAGLLPLGFRASYLLREPPRGGLAFYNVRGCPAVLCLPNDRWPALVCADSLTDVTYYNRSIAPHLRRLRLPTPQKVWGPHTDDDLLVVADGLLNCAGRWVCLVRDDRWRYRSAGQPLPLDYALITSGYRGQIADLARSFNLSHVVLDASLSSSRQQEMENECLRMGIACTRLAHAGYLEDW